MRLPLAELPGVLAKLCSSHALCWNDLVVTHGGAGGGVAAAKGDPASMLNYLNKHSVTAKLNAAVNAIAREQPADPIAALIKLLGSQCDTCTSNACA